MKKFWIFCFLAVAFCAQSVYAQRQTLLVNPQVTDAEINVNLEPHYVAINRSATPKNQLLVFLPGTGGLPQYYQLISNRAADLGFHVINLNYPNDEAVRDLCGAPNADLDCYARVRMEILDGTDRTNLVNVNRANSIENRLVKLLVYLQTQFPNDNWTQFLAANNSQIQWSKIVVAGHSQGAGHAGIIGRFHSVSRVIMFAGMDFNGVAGAPANWIARPETTPNATATDRFFGFSHTRDDSVNFTVLTTRVWTAYGMNNYGAVVNVDTTTPPYNNTHSLTTNYDCANTHGCTVVDAATPIGTGGTAVFRPVWEYLLSGTTVPFAVNSLQFARNNGQIVIRPLVGLTTKYYKLILQGTNFTETSKVFVSGIEVETEFINATELRAKLPAGKIGGIGRSTIQIRNSNGQTTNVLSF
ncbi:MAG TPA: IPT/TIG domain-containing protein [Pyrinomonadaceae bacterium]|jgi:hypothetical protein